MKVISRIGPWSLGRLLGVVYAVIGFVAGLIVSLITVFSAAWVRDAGPLFGLFFGSAAFILFPILYGVIGLIGGVLVGVIYNAAARRIGGLQVELTDL